MRQVRLSASRLALLAALFIVAANNTALMAGLAERMETLSLPGLGFLVTLASLAIGVLFFLFLVLGVGRLLKPVIIAFIMLAAFLGYFTNRLGVVFDLEMVRNAIETIDDGNAQEAAELLSRSLWLYLVLLGVAPSIAVASVTVIRQPAVAEFRTRTLYLATALVLFLSTGLINNKYVTYFARENEDLQMQITPIYGLVSAGRYLRREHERRNAEFNVLGGDARQEKSIRRRTVGIMVVGETARADRFSLNGYERTTNPRLESEPGVDFFDATSCGTSTAYSVPCMFSMRDREHYSPAVAKSESNVLDVLSSAGVNVVWIDDNSSCKGVCSRIENINLRHDPDESSPLYSDGGYYDEAMLQYLDRYLDDDSRDVLIVLHSLGSHGPSYSRRYPADFAVFKPFCEKNSPVECSDDEVNNAYDNTIVYTDYVLSRVIGVLKERDGQFESFMLYASDHGESLGEKGIYLHGLPYSLAPRAQTEVPMIFWRSESFAAHHRFSQTSTDVADRLSHDNISHTLLGLFEVSTRVHDWDKDLFDPSSITLSQNQVNARR